MVFKLAKEAEKTWKKIKGYLLIPKVHERNEVHQRRSAGREGAGGLMMEMGYAKKPSINNI
jgi:hypothetical protein